MRRGDTLGTGEMFSRMGRPLRLARQTSGRHAGSVSPATPKTNQASERDLGGVQGSLTLMQAGASRVGAIALIDRSTASTKSTGPHRMDPQLGIRRVSMVGGQKKLFFPQRDTGDDAGAVDSGYTTARSAATKPGLASHVVWRSAY